MEMSRQQNVATASTGDLGIVIVEKFKSDKNIYVNVKKRINQLIKHGVIWSNRF